MMNSRGFDIVILPLQDKLFRFAISILKNAANAEDALQEVLVKLWERRAELHKYACVEAFAMRVMKNYCIDKLRGVKNTSELSNTLLDNSIRTPETQTELKDITNFAYNLIEQLPPMQQMVMRLRDVEDYDLDEIAEIMDISPAAVRTNLSRARHTVRQQLLKIELFDLQLKN